MRILLVEDEPRVADFIVRGLREQSYAVDVARDGEEALYKADVSKYDLIILDVNMPVKDGFQVCKELRGMALRVPVLMLTARDAVADRVQGLDSGADDYMSKPFDFKELLARVRALLRRETVFRPAILQAADLSLNTANHVASRGNRSISLTPKEYSLLEFFMLRLDKVVSREEIASHVWDENFDPFSNIIDVYVRRLRRKIDSGAERPLIHTRRGEGYYFSASTEGDDA